MHIMLFHFESEGVNKRMSARSVRTNEGQKRRKGAGFAVTGETHVVSRAILIR